jgi:hypothetical protein
MFFDQCIGLVKVVELGNMENVLRNNFEGTEVGTHSAGVDK